MTQDTFIFRKDWLEALDELQDDSRARVIGALVTYAFMTDEERVSYNPLFDTAERIAYLFIRKCIDRDQEAYSAKVSNGRKGGAPKGNKNATKTTRNNRKTTSDEIKTTEKQPKNNQKQPYQSQSQSQYQSQSYSSSFSSFADVFGEHGSEEEEQQQEIAEYLMLERNAMKAQEEAKRLIAYNNLPDHTPLFEQTHEQRKACMDLWEFKAKGPRFDDAFLDAWKLMNALLNDLDAPLSVRKAATSDDIALTRNGFNVKIRCPKILYMAIELFLDELKPAMEMLGRGQKSYELCDQDGDKEQILRTLAMLRQRKRQLETENQ